MNHSWDYGDSGARFALTRKCRKCWVTGSRPWSGTRDWVTTSRGVVFLGAIRVPPCTGTPWLHYRYGDGSMSWVLPGPRGIENDTPEKLLPDSWIAEHGRERIEASLAEQGYPLLPEAAWAVPA